MASDKRDLVVKVGEVARQHQPPNGKPQGPFAVANRQVRVAANVASQNVQVAGQNISRQCAQVRVEKIHAQVGNAALRTVTEPNASRPSPNIPRALLPVPSSEREVGPHTSHGPLISPGSQNGRSVGGGSKTGIGDTPYPQLNRHSGPRASPSQDLLPITNGAREPVLQTTQSSPTMQDGARQVIERTSAASKQVAGIKIEKVEHEAGNMTVGKVRGQEIVEEERKVVHQEAEYTDDGITFRQYERTERVFYTRVFEIMYIASLNEPEEPPEPTTGEKCIDCCCQSIYCNCSKLCQSLTRRNPKETKSAFRTINYMTPVLRRGRSTGWAIHMELIPDIIKESCRNWWVSFKLCTVIIAFVLSITSFSLGNNRIFNVLHLALTVLGSILAITDGIILLCGCTLFKTCRGCCDRNDREQHTGYRRFHDSEEDMVQDGKCKRCITETRNVFDLIRMLYSELLFYPLLICDIFEVVTGKAYLFNNVRDGISFTLFALSSLSLFFYVYVVRLIILIVANIHSQRERRPKPNEKVSDYNPAIRKAAKYFQCYFIYHVAVQMVAQILMIIAIGAKIQDDNSHLFEDAENLNETNDTIIDNSTVSTTLATENDDTIHVSGTLWYMLVAGYVLPVFGLFTFFVVTYFWVQEFPIGFCIDVLSLLKASNIGDVMDFKKAKKDKAREIDKIKDRFVNLPDLKKQFKDLRQKGCCDKFSYPLFTPQMVIICLVYSFLQLGFIICAGVSTSGNGPLGGGHWEVYYFLAVIIGFIANFYVFVVALLWSALIICVLVSLAMLLNVICCVIFACLVIPSDDQRRRY